MNLKEGMVYKIQNLSRIREKDNIYKYIRLKYWDGKNWVVRFIAKGSTDWIALTEGRLFEMINKKIITKVTPAEKLDAIIIERNNNKVWGEK